MAINKKLKFEDKLPLTCSRSGTCCHGKMVHINPWELACMAKAKKITVSEFRDCFCDFGGIRLRFDGPKGWKDLHACSQYITDFGCSIHSGRPLVCRLYPLGRQKQDGVSRYIYQGKEFPCLEGCPEVVELPQLSVGDYIVGQSAEKYEVGQDEYLEFMQNLADGAFVLLLESGLAESGDTKTLRLWREMGNETPEKLCERLGAKWVDLLMLPELDNDINDPVSYSRLHYELLITKAEESFSSLESLSDYSKASGLMMGMALHLGRSVGADPSELIELWIKTAKENGAQE